mmetsp:Transcript_31378/g.89030  ORF Transcript_31378/g.89030 Transcript_31378/m.89030 type:complete len:125 (-) Transcript_31378:1022-1396(-)
MSVTNPSRKSTSWEATITQVPSGTDSASHCCSQRVAERSRWVEGSSSIRSSGSENSALASATRIRQPPLRTRVVVDSGSGRPRPASRSLALATASLTVSPVDSRAPSRSSASSSSAAALPSSEA